MRDTTDAVADGIAAAPSGPDGPMLLGLAEAYHERATRLLSVEELGGHLTKVYAIEAPGRTVNRDGWAHALRIADHHLRQARGMGSTGLGCVLLHAGGDGDYLLVHSWIEGYMSRLGVFSGPMDASEALRPASTGLAPCVWEAAVIAHERDAFVHHVLAGSGPLDERLDKWSADAFAAEPEPAR